MNFSGDDIRLDEKAVSAAINRACERNRLRVEGIAALDDTLTVICSSSPEQAQYIYRVSKLEGEGKQELWKYILSKAEL